MTTRASNERFDVPADVADGAIPVASKQSSTGFMWVPIGSLVTDVVGDGATDDSAAVQAAIDAVSTAAVAAGGPARVVMPAGLVVRCNVVLKPRVILDLNGCVLKPAVSSNADVVKGLNFATLTGKAYASGDVALGCYQAGVINGTIDGDKANQTAGYGIRLWGRSLRVENVIVQNCKDGGIWTEFTTHDAGATADMLEGYFNNIKVSNNNGDGWRYRGPHDSYITNFVAVSNTGYAFKSESSAGSYDGGCRGNGWNSWLNTGGSFYFGGSIILDNADATAANVGIGIEIAAGNGASKLRGITIAGHTVGLLARGDGGLFSGFIGNTTSDGIQIGSAGGGNGAGRWIIDVVGYGTITGFALNLVNEAAPTMARGRFNVTTGGLLNGTPSAGDSIDLWNAAGTFATYFPGTGLRAVGWNPKYPASNGTMVCCDLQGATTVGAAGTAAALPGQPLGYARIQLPDGTSVKVPYYNL